MTRVAWGRMGCTLAAALCGLGTWASGALAAPTLGFRDDFTTSVGTWTGGVTLSDPGTGGVGGAGDGYLVATRTTLGSLGARSTSADYIGDWAAAGITQIRMWVLDQGATGDLELHLCIGDTGNFWEYVPGIVPATDAWREYVVHLDQPADWVQIIGLGSFAAALGATDRILIRHDRAPFTQDPDPVIGAFGLDHVLLTDGAVSVAPDVAGATRMRLDPPFPDPARTQVGFRLRAPAGETATLHILDVTGREVRRVTLTTAADGTRVWVWDGTDASGSPVPAGIYRVRLGAGGGPEQRLVWLR